MNGPHDDHPLRRNIAGQRRRPGFGTLQDDWLQQIGLDAGLSGMESLLTEYHKEHTEA
jgi:hypothetical protein